jgi:predicted RNase H-related nuclease YkuK (DUF458 family)
MNWRKLSNGDPVILDEYLPKWLSENPGNKIYIGCDSHNTSAKTTFAVVIVLHNSGRGGHVLYKRIQTPRIQSSYERLWKEVELSVEAAQYVMDHNIQPDYIDIDLNPDPKYQSNSLLRAAVGLIHSLGIEARYKSMSPWAISVADALCK